MRSAGLVDRGPDVIGVEVVKLGLMLIQPRFYPLEPRANHFRKGFQRDRVCCRWPRIPRRVRREFFLLVSLSSLIPLIAFRHWQVYAALSPVRSQWRTKH